MRRLTGFCLAIVALATMALAGCSSPHNFSTESIPADGGSIAPIPGTHSGNVVIVASPEKYYKFVGWAGDAAGSTNPITVRMNSDKHIVALFEKEKPPIQVKSNPPEGGTVRPESGNYEAGISESFTAIPANRYRFVQWEADASGKKNPLILFIDGSKIITANFIKQYYLKSTSEPFNAGSVIPEDGLYDDGSKLTLNAIPNFPYHPNKWIGTDTDTNPASLIMDSDKSITVVFEPNLKDGTKTQAKAVSKDALGRWSDVFSETIQLNQFDWVEGELVWQTPNTPNTPIQSYIQDPAGNIVKDFGSNKQANFQFFAPNAGQYSIVFKNNSIWYADFHLTYTVWEK